MTYKVFQQSFSNKTILLICIGLFLFVACAPPLPPADPVLANELRNEALKSNLKHDYASAAELYKEATLYDPLNSSAYLNLADLLETLEKPAEAVVIYERALKYLPAEDMNREFMIYRSSLLLAAKLDKPEKAKSSLEKLTTPALKHDLAGVIVMNQNEPVQSLTYFQNALKYEMERNQYARVYFHVAQAYDLSGDENSSRDALLIAVEKATSRPLKEDIRRFFEAMLTRK